MKENVNNAELPPQQFLYLMMLARLGAVMGTPYVTPLKFALQLAVTVVFSALAVWLVRRQKVSRPVRAVGGAAAVALAAADFVRVYELLDTETQRTLPPFAVLALLAIAVLYACFAGLEPLARTGLLFLLTVLLFLVTAMLCSAKAFRLSFPWNGSGVTDVPYTALDIPLLYLLLAGHVRVHREKALVTAVCAATVMTALLFAACIFSMGNAVFYSAFPVRSLFELEGLGSALNLDVLFSSSYLISVFFRTAMLIRAGVPQR